MNISAHRAAIWALLLTIPIPSLGVWLGMFVWPDTTVGETAFAIAKCWILAFPIAWLIYHHKRITWPPINRRGIVAGFTTGIAMAVVIVVAFIVFGKDSIDAAELQKAMQEVGLLDPSKYLLLAAYWTFINSLLEEYLWRWFIVSRAESIMTRNAAVLLSALGFVAHHFIAMSLYFDFSTSLLACVGIFFAGITWSMLYLRTRNILGCYISHIWADAAIFGLGYALLFT